MNGICLIWSRGRLISPSLPVGDDRYLNLSSEKRPTGRNLGGNRLVRRSGTTSRGTVALVFCLRMRRFSSNSSSYHIRGNEMNCVGSSEYMTVFTSFTRASFLNPLTAEWALRAHIDFTLSNARWFYSSMGNPLAGKGLTAPLTCGRISNLVGWSELRSQNGPFYNYFALL